MYHIFEIVISGKVIDVDEIVSKKGDKLYKYIVKNNRRYYEVTSKKKVFEIGQELEKEEFRLVIMIEGERSRFFIVKDIEE